MCTPAERLSTQLSTTSALCMHIRCRLHEGLLNQVQTSGWNTVCTLTQTVRHLALMPAQIWKSPPFQSGARHAGITRCSPS